ncbi:PH domain-containing protein [Candidatus Omnitrophota bacterium]
MKETFSIISGSSGPLWFFLIMCCVLVPLILLFGYMAFASRLVKFEVSREGLRITKEIYGRQIPLESLRIDKAEIINLRNSTQYRLKSRTNGTGLPGYKAGWFRLQNGEKALVFVTDMTRVLYLPTDQDYSLLLSAENPEGLIKALQDAQ